MARGKYKNAAEARRVREEAVSEAEAGRRQIAKLTDENRTLRETLAAEREAHSARLREMNALLAEGASPEVAALRDELDSLRRRAKSERLERAKKVVAILDGTPWVDLSSRSHIQMAEALGVGVGDLFSDKHSRRVRRMTRRMANLTADVESDPSLVVKK